MKLYLLATNDDHYGLVATLHATKEAAYNLLREAFDGGGDLSDVSNEFLISRLEEAPFTAIELVEVDLTKRPDLVARARGEEGQRD